MAAAVAFDMHLKHGLCIGVRIPAEDEAVLALSREALLPEEARYAERLAPLVRRTWIGGRVALREVFGRMGIDAPPVMPNDRGAPGVPIGIAASITHKAGLAVALAARESSAHVGVDLELDVSRAHDIARRVLTADELEEVAPLAPTERTREVLLRFSAKEAIYKALDPFVRRFVGFQEVAVRPCPDGSGAVQAALTRGEGPFAIDVTWRRFDGVVLTTARVVPRLLSSTESAEKRRPWGPSLRSG